uniref:Uncharacterized protein n=1 Tax=Tanacetum cinerariifolium TaxID=118510 RepID=A0A6L2LPN4_TANCI|nr:hypothetical protein [Tanacetum cinerariifolium]
MISDSSGGDLSDVDDFDDFEMIMKQVQAEHEKEEVAERVRHRNYIYRERIEAEERLKADYFAGVTPDSLDEYLQMVNHCARDCLDFFTMNEEIAQKDGMSNLLEVIKTGANNDLTVLNNSPLFDDLLDDIVPVASFEYSEKNALFKRKQESARKDVERAFGVLQGRWHIICHGRAVRSATKNIQRTA